MLCMKFRIISSALTEPMFPIWKLSIINCLCISSTELTSILGIGLLLLAYTILISSPVHLAKHWSILIFVVSSFTGSRHWCCVWLGCYIVQPSHSLLTSAVCKRGISARMTSRTSPMSAATFAMTKSSMLQSISMIASFMSCNLNLY